MANLSTMSYDEVTKHMYGRFMKSGNETYAQEYLVDREEGREDALDEEALQRSIDKMIEEEEDLMFEEFDLNDQERTLIHFDA